MRTSSKLAYFPKLHIFEDLLLCIISGPKKVASFAPTSQVRVSTMLLLLVTVRNKKERHLSALYWHNAHSKFRKEVNWYESSNGSYTDSKLISKMHFPSIPESVTLSNPCCNGKSETNSSCFIACYLQVGHIKIPHYFATALLKAYLFLSAVSIFVKTLFPPENKGMYYRSVQILLLSPLQPLYNGILQCFVIGFAVSSQAFPRGPMRYQCDGAW